jgi:hypothetical protein
MGERIWFETAHGIYALCPRGTRPCTTLPGATMLLTNTLRLPEAIVLAVANDEYSRGEADFSVTQLLAPPKLVQLRERHDNELTEDASMRMPSLVGQICHGLFERAAREQALPGVLPEERFFITRALPLGRVVCVSGQMDHVLVSSESELTDYKFPGIGSLHMKLKFGMEEWVQQVNLYRLILEENGIAVRDARVIATGLGWMFSQAERDPSYPQTQTISIPIELWPLEETEAFLMERLRVHTAVQGLDEELLPDCTESERWVTATKYAVRKPGRKSAFRVVPTKIEAEIILNDNGDASWSIETRPGISKRCGRHCAAGRAGICTQWSEEQAVYEAATGTSLNSVVLEADESALS